MQTFSQSDIFYNISILFDTVNSPFIKDLKFTDTRHFLGRRILDSVHKYFLNQTNLDLRIENLSCLNLDLPVLQNKNKAGKQQL